MFYKVVVGVVRMPVTSKFLTESTGEHGSCPCQNQIQGLFKDHTKEN